MNQGNGTPAVFEGAGLDTPHRILVTAGALARSPYPERADEAVSSADRWASGLLRRVRFLTQPSPRRELAGLARALERESAQRAALDGRSLEMQLRNLAPRAVRDLGEPDLHRALLLVAEAARRTLCLRAYPEQLAGSAALLRGRLAEMDTGEGKTLCAGLAACLAGVAGVPVHVITVNGYLAARDAEFLAPLFAFTGLRVGVVVQGMEPAARRAAYAADITYCTGKEVVFDYLRDRVAAGGRSSPAQLRARRLFGTAEQPLLMRGLHLAIVDEADSILIDEARTPLILAERSGPIEHAAAFGQALEIAHGLAAGIHYTIDAGRRQVSMRPAGLAQVAQACPGDVGVWRSARAREHLISQALRAQHLFQRDRHYLIDTEGRLQIIDEYTGRLLPGRVWEQGLHQMIECKEGCVLSEQTQTLARITYQRFFPRYLRLAGITGTAREVAREIEQVYGLQTVAIPPHRPNQRRRLPDRVCSDEVQKWQAVARLAAQRQQLGQAVLVGTRSVEASERLSRVLREHGLAHEVLNARQDAGEAAVIARAGRAGAITVATNMAGRGTDIRLGDGVAQCGGLFVILTEYHESQRIDRQLFGRCARQGDPGSCQAIVALDDDLFRRHGGLERLLLHDCGIAHWLTNGCRRAAQARAEKGHARARRDTARQDRELDTMMAFSGEPL